MNYIATKKFNNIEIDFHEEEVSSGSREGI